MQHIKLKLFISLMAITAIIVRLIWPDVRIDAISLGLLVLAVLPWLSELIESAKFPGGWEVKFRDVKAAEQKITIQSSANVNLKSKYPSYLSVAETDPNLALVGLRIEIENRLRLLSVQNGISENQPLSSLIRELMHIGVLDETSSSGLRELVSAGNKAAHGARVEPPIANWVFEKGPEILAALDTRLSEGESGDIKKRLKQAFDILEIEGPEITDTCITLLKMAKRDGSVRVYVGTDPKHRARDVLIKLGALDTVGEESKHYPTLYRITAFGNALLSHLLIRGQIKSNDESE